MLISNNKHPTFNIIIIGLLAAALNANAVAAVAATAPVILDDTIAASAIDVAASYSDGNRP